MGLQLRRVSLQNTAPPFPNQLLIRRIQGGGLRVDAAMTWVAQVDAQVDTAVATAGLSGVSLEGVLTVVLTPADVPPFLSVIDIYFANAPAVELEFTGLAQLAHLPGLSGHVAASVEAALAKEVVLPSRVVLSLLPGPRPALSPPPCGVLRMTLLGVEGVQSVDWSSIDSVRLLRIRLGGGPVWSTPAGAVPVGRDSSSPYMWASPPPRDDWDIADYEQRLHFDVCDGGWTPLAAAAEVPAGSLVRCAKEGRTLQLALEPQGSLHLHLDWLTVGQQPPRRTPCPAPLHEQLANGSGLARRAPRQRQCDSPASSVCATPTSAAGGSLGSSIAELPSGGPAPPLVALTAEVMRVTGLPPTGAAPFCVKLVCGVHSRSTMPGRARWEVGNQDPGLHSRDSCVLTGAINLLRSGVSPDIVASSFSLPLATVKTIAAHGAESRVSIEAFRTALEDRQKTTEPFFDQSVHIRMRYAELMQQRHMQLEVVDSEGDTVGVAVYPLPPPAGRVDFTYDGPFSLPLKAIGPDLPGGRCEVTGRVVCRALWPAFRRV
eukprot:TRINITY_DN4569_c0_g4_i1.p1 TRINITY_DN4569_c0_g4~~TRINITY_DN4569_c0_g4_i1.p1  ORF type:complete len:546 (+),score=137.42 TRINITY_DN4569_c0_g4_i1:780-2417(+)